MLGCLRRIGCLIVLVVLVLAAWLFRDRWWPRVFGATASPAAVWEPVTVQGGANAASALATLGRTNGPVFVNLKAADIAGMLVGAEGPLPSSIQGAEAAVDGDQVRLRATIALDDIKGLDALGPLGDLLGKREQIALGGMLDVVGPGTAELRVTSVQVGQFPVPQSAIPALITRLTRGHRAAGAAPNGVAFPVPPYVGDIRIGKGKVTVYKNVS